ncbi:hypothetical protein T459_28232 [Capsicum annuum]|uniref:Peptidase A1 domain-containing protein n=1 Tax=Capsicum annuum TaxID=4072 RepID=A0A2G2YG95_CAPAN|nr:putative aspartic proteinase-like protein 2-like isoform X2 [Capsicum annuum]PHT68745.1 hypothetical protein T459_28232 [Capsicum annuum]
MSSTYQTVKCDKACPCDLKRQQCIYERWYAEMSSSFGLLGENVISFGNLKTGDLYSQCANGIMGLGRGDVSIVDQLVEKYVISDSFSLCYGGMDFGGGVMVLGGINPPAHMVFTKSDFGMLGLLLTNTLDKSYAFTLVSDDNSPYYNIELKEILVAGKPLKINPRVFGGKYGTILDSGTTCAYLPEAAFIAFKSVVMKEFHSLKQIKGADPSFNDICSGVGCDMSLLAKNFLPIDMVFRDGNKLILFRFLFFLLLHFKVRGAYCIGIFPNGKNLPSLLRGTFHYLTRFFFLTFLLLKHACFYLQRESLFATLL